MKKLYYSALMAGLTAVLTACPQNPPPIVEPLPSATANLSVAVQGVPSAPVTVKNSAGAVAFSETVTGSKTFSSLPRDKYTVSGAAVNGYSTPVDVTADLTAGDGSATLSYTAQPGTALTAGSIQGTLSDPLVKGNLISAYILSSSGSLTNLAKTAIGADGSVNLALPDVAASQLTRFLPAPGSSCSYAGTGAGSALRATQLDTVVAVTAQGDVLGDVLGVPVGGTSTALLTHLYADSAQSFQGTVSCPASTPPVSYALNLQFVQGWNSVIIDVDAKGNFTLTSTPAGTRVNLVFKRAASAVNLYLDTQNIALKAGGSQTVNASFQQIGGISGAIDLSTDVPGVTISPASVTLPTLGASQGVSVQSLATSASGAQFWNGQQDVSQQSVGQQSLKTPLTVQAAANAASFSGTMNIIAKQGGVVVGKGSVSLALTAPSVSVNFTVSPNTGTPSIISLAQGETTSVPVIVYGSNGFTGPVTVSLTGLPSGVSVTPNVVQVTAGTSVTTNLQLTASGTAAVGSTTVTVTTDAKNETPSVYGSNKTELRLMPARALLPNGASGIYPAANGVWLAASSANNTNTLTRYVNGVVQNSVTLDSSFGILSGLRGDLLAVKSNVTDGTVRTIHDDGTYQDVSTDVGIGSAAGNGKSVTDAGGNIWYIKVNVVGMGGLTTSLNRYNTNGTVDVIPGVTPDFMSNRLSISNDGKTLVIKSGTSSLFSKIDTVSGKISPISTPVQGITQVAVSNQGVLWWTSLNGVLQRLEADGSVTSFNSLSADGLSGFDRQNPNVLWTYSSGKFTRLTINDMKMTDIYFDSSNVGRSALSLNGGLDFFYTANNNASYLSHIN